MPESIEFRVGRSTIRLGLGFTAAGLVAGLITVGMLYARVDRGVVLAESAATKQDIARLEIKADSAVAMASSARFWIIRHQEWSTARSREIDGQHDDTMKELERFNQRITYLERGKTRDRGGVVDTSGTRLARSLWPDDWNAIEKVTTQKNGKIPN